MKLIDRYVTEVGKRLVLVKGHQDIEKELRSTLEDMLEDRSQKSGRPADEAMEIELLKEYGSPDKVAETYNPFPYLIGPRLFPIFVMLLKIVLGAVALGLVVAIGVQIITHPPQTMMELIILVGKGKLNILTAFISAFGYLTLIFAILERFTLASEYKFGSLKKVGNGFLIVDPAEEKEGWDPAVLIREPEPQEVKIWEPILAIVFTLFVIYIFNFNQQWLNLNYYLKGIWVVGFGDLVPGKLGSIPLFSEAFFHWLPLMNMAWIAEIFLNGMLLRSGRWTISTRLFSIGVKTLQIVINLVLLAGPFILGITAEALAASKVMDLSTAQAVSTALRTAMPVLLGLGIFGKLIEIGQVAGKMVKQAGSSKAS
jgi:hypothetical protein